MAFIGGYYADAAYTNDFVTEITVGATSTASFTMPQIEGQLSGANPAPTIKWRTVTITDISAATGGTAPSLIAVYFRIDGQTAGASTATLSPYNASTFSRLLKPGASITLSRSQITQLTFQNPNGTAVKLQVELGG